ncbi:helix-turn-helix domain-containing protein [Janibacter anophelis]|uniref:AlbA family DNA-binding domain-containing protein n=1 Tax=Janibacter anophelis TaxID=319054 RepID=UPI000DEFBBDB|nr:ATP-binding protein [Janibacter anophelis]
MFTPIHRALGLKPGDITWDLIEGAVEQKVEEAADLDWKQSGYLDSRNPQWQDEVAKDIAAMANSGGGWIILGVAEDGATSAAAEITPIVWNAAAEQKVRQAAYARIGPPVTGIEFTPVQGDGGYVVLLRVPDSREVPHFARKGQDAFVAPRRNGPHTVFLSDREIEQAFRSRFHQNDDRERHLQSLFEEAALPLDPTEGVALVAAAVPFEPLNDSTPIDDHTARNLFHQTFTGGLLAKQNGWGWCYGDVRKGLRRWTMRGTQAPEVYAKGVHEDGTVLASYRLGNLETDKTRAQYYPVGRPNDCMSMHVEHALVDAVALLRNSAQSLNVQGGYRMRVGLVGAPGSPMHVRTTEGFTNLLLDLEYLVPIHRFHPVTFDLDPLESVEENLPIIREAALDVINQGGVRYLHELAETSSAPVS